MALELGVLGFFSRNLATLRADFLTFLRSSDMG
jgi:hypothetical protein